jgi:hypothetical protein
MRQFCIYTQDPKFLEVSKWITTNKIKFESHLNRTRFWIPEDKIMTEFLLKYSECCPQVSEDLDNVLF